MNGEKMHERPARLALFGRYTRYVLSSHLSHATVIALALLCIALAVELPPQIGESLADAKGFLSVSQRLLWLILLRSADLLPRFLPLAAFLAIIWTRLGLALRRERILVWNTGRSALQTLGPALIFALMMGSIQYNCDTWLRPAAFLEQVRSRLGTYGIAFDPNVSKDAVWIALGDDLLHAGIAFGPPPVMQALTLYRLDRIGRLREVDNARTASFVMPGTLLLQNGGYWIMPPETVSGPAAVPLSTRGTAESETYFVRRRIALEADPLWFSVWGIYPEYLFQGTLRSLVRARIPEDQRSSYLARLEFNYANALMPGAMIFLAEVLCIVLFAYGIPLHLQLATLLAGYGAHLAMKTLLLLGVHDYLMPGLAPWLTPVALILLSGGLLSLSSIKADGRTLS